MTDVAARPNQPTMGTAVDIERARAVAEVQAAVVVAQQCPRDLQAALAAMRELTAVRAMADRAFFAYARAGSSITGPTIHLARELARVWGNVQYGIEELRRDDAAQVSEMRAWAWDVQTNTRSSSIFIVPHARDTKQGRKAIVDLRDVYENNANQGARRVREAIFSVLPAWFVEEAKDRCTATLRDGGGQTLAQQVAEIVENYETRLGISIDRIEAALERKSSSWTVHDVSSLRVKGGGIARGELVADEEFPKLRRTSAAEITGQPAASSSATSNEGAKSATTDEARARQAAAEASWEQPA